MSNKNNIKVLLYEPEHTGHHLADLARLLPGILALPVEVVVTTSQSCLESNEFKTTLEEFRTKVEWDTSCRPVTGNLLKLHWQQLLEFRAAIKRHDADHAYIMMGDGRWQILAFLKLLHWQPWKKTVTVDTYLIRGGFTYPEATSFKDKCLRWLFKSLMRRGPLKHIMVLDEQLGDYAKSIEKSLDYANISLAPAPVPQLPAKTQLEARACMGLPEDGRMIVMLGMIQPLRGAERVLNAYLRYVKNYSQPKDKLLLAGPHSSSIVSQLEKDPWKSLQEEGRLLSINRYLNDQEMFDCAACGDIITMGTHRHKGRSSVIMWAAANGRPVVTTDTGTIGYVVDKMNLGYTCNVTDAEAFAQTLSQAMSQAWTLEDAERVKAYARWSSLDNYQEIGTLTLRIRLETQKKL